MTQSGGQFWGEPEVRFLWGQKQQTLLLLFILLCYICYLSYITFIGSQGRVTIKKQPTGHEKQNKFEACPWD